MKGSPEARALTAGHRRRTLSICKKRRFRGGIICLFEQAENVAKTNVFDHKLVDTVRILEETERHGVDVHFLAIQSVIASR
jgi:hypothetical protein